MGFLNRIFNKSDIEKRLIGNWFSDLNDELTRDTTGDVKMSFTPGKELIYEIREKDKRQIIFMTFVVKGNKIITDQPSHPQKEESEFYFDDDDKLIIKFDGIEGRFIKEIN